MCAVIKTALVKNNGAFGAPFVFYNGGPTAQTAQKVSSAQQSCAALRYSPGGRSKKYGPVRMRSAPMLENRVCYSDRRDSRRQFPSRDARNWESHAAHQRHHATARARPPVLGLSGLGRTMVSFGTRPHQTKPSLSSRRLRSRDILFFRRRCTLTQ